MLVYKGKYNSAIVMVDSIDEATVAQIYSFLNHPAFAKTHIAIMADCHAGAGSCIGYTATMNDYIIPAVVGVDIGCGVLAIPLNITELDREHLDHFIHKSIPCGKNIRSYNETMANGKKPHQAIDGKFQKRLVALAEKVGSDGNKAVCAVGTLGGGNHFIEVAKSDDGEYWLLIHSGSRNLGLRVANYHQRNAKALMNKMFVGADAFKSLEFMPVTGDLATPGCNYLNDMQVAQEFASINRLLMAEIIMMGYFKIGKWDTDIHTIHNYINFDDKIVRKGAVSAHDGERLVVPFNSLQGSMICTGKGSQKWNFSAPHGAGRIMSRRKAKENLDVGQYKQDMKDADVYTSTANASTLDECWKAYKDMETIVEAVKEVVDVDFFIKPVYSFKASEEE